MISYKLGGHRIPERPFGKSLDVAETGLKQAYFKAEDIDDDDDDLNFPSSTFMAV